MERKKETTKVLITSCPVCGISSFAFSKKHQVFKCFNCGCHGVFDYGKKK